MLNFKKRNEKIWKAKERDLKELRKAIGLHAQGIGVGAFVYVRRIFERLIDKAKELAIAASQAEKAAQYFIAKAESVMKKNEKRIA